ncbi:putative oxidoreductase TM_0325 [Ciona intestinalis]
MDVTKRVVLITGSSTGIGAGTAKGFAKEGASLCITGLPAQKDELAEVAKVCKENGSPHVLEVAADLRKQEDMDLLMNETIKTFGQLDVLVNNAGIQVYGDIEQYTSEEFDNVFSVNVKAMMYLTKLAKLYLSKTKGNIVNLCSVVRDWYLPKFIVYGMSKAAIEYLTKTTAADFAEIGVRCNAACPGMVLETNILINVVPEEVQQQFRKDCSTKLRGRTTTKSEVSDLIRFLASDKATMITGELVNIDGGKMLSLTA